MRACEGCRRRKIKCDAATTNTWPCSACIRLKLHCVRPNGFDPADATAYDTLLTAEQFQEMQMQMQRDLAGYEEPSYGGQNSFGVFQAIPYDPSAPPHQQGHYTTVPQPQFPMQHSFPTPPAQQNFHQDSSPSAHSIDSYQQQDLADLLGSLKLNELGTGKRTCRVFGASAHET